MKPEETQKIKVTDKLMSTGKTHVKLSEIKQKLIDNPENKFIYAVITKDEIKRVLNDCSGVFTRPTYGVDEDENQTFLMQSFMELVTSKQNIVTTHSLFLNLANEDIGNLRELLKEYNLILDEVPDVVGVRKEMIGDVNEFYENGTIIIDEKDNNKVSWNPLKANLKNSSLSELKNRIEQGSITAVMIKDEKSPSGKKILAMVWNYPEAIFRAFNSVEVLTYLFEDSLFRAYLRVHKFGYTMPVYYTEHLYIKKVKSLISVYEGKYNNIGDDGFSLSHRWYKITKENNKTRPEEIKTLKQNTINFFRNQNTTSYENAFSVYKDQETKLQGRGYTKFKEVIKDGEKVRINKCFIAINARATNDYSHKKSIAYLANRFYDKRLFSYFNQYEVNVSQDGLALSELLQLIFRGNIRNMNKIYADGTPLDASMMIYIPSKRMRDLLNYWLNQNVNDVRNYRNRKF